MKKKKKSIKGGATTTSLKMCRGGWGKLTLLNPVRKNL